jgi:hypothetical protein
MVKLFWSFFSKACQYAIIDEKMYRNFKYIFIKCAQAICKSASLGPKNLERVGMSGKKLVLQLVYAHEN